MAPEVDEAAETSLEDGLLVPAQPVDLLNLALVSLSGVLEQGCLLHEPFLRGFQADEGSCADIAGGHGSVETLDGRGDGGRVGGNRRNLQLGLQPGDVVKVL